MTSEKFFLFPLSSLKAYQNTALLLAGLLIAFTSAACQKSEQGLPSPQVDSTNTLTRDLLDTMQRTDNLDSFIVALKRTQLADEVAQAGPYTVFAPTNAAFSQTSTRLDTLYFTGSADTLRKLVEFHLAYGRYDVPDIAQDSLQISTLAQIPITLKRSDSTLLVNSTPVTRSVETQNGILHLIPALLSPPLPDTSEQTLPVSF